MTTGILLTRPGKPAECVSGTLAAVKRLLLLGGPAAILGRVIAIVIDAIKSHACGWIAHVGSECERIIKPPSADRYAPSAIAFKAPVAGIGAALNHAVPNKIYRQFGNAVFLIGFLTPARCVNSRITKVSGPDNAQIPAFAPAQPFGIGLTRRAWNSFNRSYEFELVSGLDSLLGGHVVEDFIIGAA